MFTDTSLQAVIRLNGITYDEYLRDWDLFLAKPTEDLDKEDRKKLHYYRYNKERSRRVHDAFEPSDELDSVLDAVTYRQVWMVLTESWCGDSAFVLPGIAEVAARSERIDLRILYRDQNLEVMDQYLTNGGRSIPKMVAYDEAGSELFQYGPRPAGAVAERERLLATGADHAAVIAGLVEWYEAGGWKEVQTELIDLLKHL